MDDSGSAPFLSRSPALPPEQGTVLRVVLRHENHTSQTRPIHHRFNRTSRSPCVGEATRKIQRRNCRSHWQGGEQRSGSQKRAWLRYLDLPNPVRSGTGAHPRSIGACGRFPAPGRPSRRPARTWRTCRRRSATPRPRRSTASRRC
jgi:hypothetical protein